MGTTKVRRECMQDVAGRRCYVTFELIRVRQVIRLRSVPNVKTAGGSDDIVRNVVRHCSEFVKVNAVQNIVL